MTGDTASATPEVPDPPAAEASSGPTWRDRARTVTRHLTELPMLILAAFVIAVVIKTFLIQAFYIPSESMQPALQPGDRVLVEKISYRLHDPNRGDMVVFEKSVFGVASDVPWYADVTNFLRELLGLPIGEEEDYIKRIVAVGGDAIRYSGSPRRLVINGDVVPQPFIRGGRDRFSSSLTAQDCQRLRMRPSEGGCLVPAGKVFVMGDNRGDSEDSRILGPIDEDRIVGRAFLIIWPPGSVGGL